jgi:hypothetical protein
MLIEREIKSEELEENWKILIAGKEKKLKQRIFCDHIFHDKSISYELICNSNPILIYLISK